MTPASLPPTPTIPAPAVIVRDVAIAGLVVGFLAAWSGAWTVMVGALASVLLMGSMAWVVAGGNPSRVMLRMLLQWTGALVGFWLFLRHFPAAPFLLGFCSLVVGVAGRAAYGVWQSRFSEGV